MLITSFTTLPSVGVKIKEGSYNFHQENTEQLARQNYACSAGYSLHCIRVYDRKVNFPKIVYGSSASLINLKLTVQHKIWYHHHIWLILKLTGLCFHF